MKRQILTFVAILTLAFASQVFSQDAKNFAAQPQLTTSEPQQSTPDMPSGAEQLLAGRGCCSWHGGQCGCQGGRVVCCDGSYSPSCTCDHDDQIIRTE